MLGKVSDGDRELLMAGADMMVQPNIAVPGDMEGFGLVTIEAAMRFTTVVASNLEGLADAVADGETGVLLPSGDVEAWATELSELLEDLGALRSIGIRFGQACRERYSVAAMGQRLRDELEKVHHKEVRDNERLGR